MSQTATAKAPKNTIQLIYMLIVNFIKGIPTMLKKMLIPLAIIFVVIIIINTYLLVVRNEGFAPTAGNPWLDFTALQGNIVWATAFWTFGMFFVTNVIGRIREDGFETFSQEVFGSGKFFMEKMKLTDKRGLPILLISIAIVLGLTLFMQSRRTLLLYSLMAFFSFTRGDKSFLLYFNMLFINDIRTLIQSKTKLANGSVYVATFGVWIGFFVGFLLRTNLFIIIITILLLGLGIYLSSTNRPAKAAIFFLALIGFNYAYYRMSGTLLADDGGWIEAGGTFSGWVGSPGAGTAIGMGIPPALGGMIGAILGGIISRFNPNDFMPDKSVFDSLYDWLGDKKPTTDGKKVNGDFIRDQDDLAKILGGLLGLDETGNMIQRGLRNLFDSTDDFSSFMKGMIKNSGRYKDFAKLMDGKMGNKLRWLKKAFEGNKASKATAYTNLIGQGATFLGGLIDSYSNYYEHGDNAANAISKGMLSNAATVYIGKAIDFAAKKGWVNGGAGTLAAWELGNQMLFGNTKMQDIASPINMVKGGVNWVYDYFSTDPKVIESRMDSGYYGENMKNIYYGSDMAQDFYNDPSGFYDELGDFTDVESGNFKKMYKSADDIFKLPDDVKANTDGLYSTDALNTAWDNPLDSVRRVATDTGKTLTKGAIMVGEGWGYIGQVTGEGSIYVEEKLGNAYNYMRSFF